MTALGTDTSKKTAEAFEAIFSASEGASLSKEQSQIISDLMKDGGTELKGYFDQLSADQQKALGGWEGFLEFVKESSD
jgi:hypothetical protein